MPLRNPQDYLLWYICRSCWQALEHQPGELNQISSCALQSGNAGEVSEGTSGFTFLVTSLLNDKEVTFTAAQRSAKQYARP